MPYEHTTLSDYGRGSDRHCDIPFYYAFKYRFYLSSHTIQPEDVAKWCYECCDGYYKTTNYTHESSHYDMHTGQFHRKVYVDRVYLANDQDAVNFRLTFNVSAIAIKRPRYKKPDETDAERPFRRTNSDPATSGGRYTPDDAPANGHANGGAP